ncbi:hypothetical protein FQN49_007038, partial [Arthroderma sp. PD_2]
MGPELHDELLECFRKATEELNLCRNRVWAVARENLPSLLPKVWPKNQSCAGAAALSTEDKGQQDTSHELCTFDFCGHSQRDFTAVAQRHECNNADDCVQLTSLFPRTTLEKAALGGTPTVWELTGKMTLKQDRPYMAISHVWSDGTGAGPWGDGQVNQ